MDVLEKVKVAAGQATTKAQEGVATLQAKRKLTHAYGELGQTTFELVQSGELTHPRLSPKVERVSAAKEELERAKRTEGLRPRRPPGPGRHRNRRRCRPSSGTYAQQPSEAEQPWTKGQRRRDGAPLAALFSLRHARHSRRAR